MQPFEAGFAHPDRRAVGVAGEKVERCAAAEADTRRVAALRNGVSDQFLLRRAYAEKHKA